MVWAVTRKVGDAVGWQVRTAGPGRRRISVSKVGILFAYVTVTRQCPVNPQIQRAVCTQTKEAAHWSQVRAPIRMHRPCHADMHEKREPAQVIGTTVSALGRMLAAGFDLLPCCAPTPRVRAVSSLAVADHTYCCRPYNRARQTRLSTAVAPGSVCGSVATRPLRAGRADRTLLQPT